jgi:tetratricopeptide (TPR) repeat protein
MQTFRAALALTLAAACGSCRAPDADGRIPPEPPEGASEPHLVERIREATRAVQDDPDSAAAWGRLGQVYDANAFGEPALSCYEAAEELDPDDWRWPYFAGLLLRAGDSAAALERLTRAAELHPGHAPLHFHLGLAHYRNEDLDRAHDHFRRAVELAPGLVNARLGLARVAVARGDPAGALAELAPLAETATGDGAVHMHLAQVYRELGRHEDADREERRTERAAEPAEHDGFAEMSDPVRDEVLKREGVGSTALLLAARDLALQGRHDEALAAIERALEADPDSVSALVVSARWLAERGRIEEARGRLQRAVELDPRNAGVRSELATVHALAGRVDPAIAELEEALRLDPRLVAARVSLAGLLVRTGRLEEAAGQLREAHDALPDDEDIRHKLAGVLRGLGRAEEAARYEGQRERR